VPWRIHELHYDKFNNHLSASVRFYFNFFNSLIYCTGIQKVFRKQQRRFQLFLLIARNVLLNKLWSVIENGKDHVKNMLIDFLVWHHMQIKQYEVLNQKLFNWKCQIKKNNVYAAFQIAYAATLKQKIYLK